MGYQQGRDHWRERSNDQRSENRDYDRQPQGNRNDYRRNRFDDDTDDRGFFERAGDQVRDWLSDDDSDMRNEQRNYGRNNVAGYGNMNNSSQQNYNKRGYQSGGGGYGSSQSARFSRNSYGQEDQQYGRQQQHDPHYHDWRERQMADFDRDYNDYRRERQSSFDSEFGSWRSKRQSQRQLVDQIREHQPVVGSDDEHVGTVDKVEGEQIKLAKNDPAAGGKHHNIPVA
jgi:hypothetical protein